MQTDGIEVASVGNTVVLHESCLVEAFNLKSAIQFNMKNCKHSTKQTAFQMKNLIILSECCKRSVN